MRIESMTSAHLSGVVERWKNDEFFECVYQYFP